MDTEVDRDASVTRFLTHLKSIPWFRSIGKPLPPNTVAKPLQSWEDWPGPDQPAIIELSLRQQALYDEILACCAGRRDEVLRLWDHIREIVFSVAATAVPYDPMQDSWHGPTTAVWQAAWTAGLVGLCIHLQRPIPADLHEQWNWFVIGHWPSGYTEPWEDDQLGRLLVF